MKVSRQAKILEIIEKYEIETQEDLALKLKEEGFNVTQATISRDIREMKLTKIATENGKQKYSVIKGSDAELSERLSGEVYFAKVRDKTTVRADLSAIAQNNDLMGIFTRKMLERAAEADADGRRRIMAALDIGLRAFNSEVNYREDN